MIDTLGGKTGANSSKYQRDTGIREDCVFLPAWHGSVRLLPARHYAYIPERTARAPPSHAMHGL